MIRDTITLKIGEAMKAHDEVRLSTLRMLSSALNYEFIEKQHPLNKDEEMAVVKREAKKRKDAIDAYEKAGAKDRVEKETKELEILKEYLPEEMSDEMLNEIIEEVISETGATGMKDMGRVIGMVMGRAGGKADGSKVSLFVKNKLSG